MAKYTLIGAGAANATTHKPYGLLIQDGDYTVLLDGLPDVDLAATLDAWLVTDDQGELIADQREVARAAGAIRPEMTSVSGGSLTITGKTVDHTNHPVVGYEIDSAGEKVIWAPKFFIFPEWAKDADLMFAEGAAYEKQIIFRNSVGGHMHVLQVAAEAQAANVKQLVYCHMSDEVAQQMQSNPPPFGEPGVEGQTYSPSGSLTAAAEDPNIVATGCMIALDPASEDVANLIVPNGHPIDEIHLTLIFLGEIADYTDQDLATTAAICDLLAPEAPAQGTISGHTHFDTQDLSRVPCVFLVDAPGLGDFRATLTAALTEQDLPYSTTHDFLPHITSSYHPDGECPLSSEAVAQSIGQTVRFVDLLLSAGPNTYSLPIIASANQIPITLTLLNPLNSPSDDFGPLGYTLAIAYPANEVDAQGDFQTPEDLEQTAWQFLLSSPQVGIEHHSGTEGAGEVVESYIYRGPDWQVGDQVVQAGDWLVGILWSEEAMRIIEEYLQEGQVPGISEQGEGVRTPV